MRKILYLLFTLFCLGECLYAQAPQAFSFQAVARNKSGEVMKKQLLELQISILADNANGAVIYREIHTTTTSDAGVLSLQIGKGQSLQGEFAKIDWASGKAFFLHTELTLNSEKIDLGTSQILSVPYALYAARSGEKHDLVLKDGVLSIKGGGTSVTLPTSTIIGGGGGNNDGSCLWTREELATATYTGSMALKSAIGKYQYLKAYTDTDEAGHLRLNLAGKSSIEMDPGSIKLVGAGDKYLGEWMASDYYGFLKLRHTNGRESYLTSGLLSFWNGTKSALYLGESEKSGSGYLSLYDGIQGNITASLDGSSFGSLTLYNAQKKPNISLAVVNGSDNNVGWIGTHDPDGNDLIRLTTFKDDYGSYYYNPSIGLHYHGELKGHFYVDTDGRSVLRTDLLYVDGYQLYSATKNYTGSNLRSTSLTYAPCFVSESLDRQITFRGTATLSNGRFKVVLPPEEAAKMEDGSMTVQITPLSADSKGLAVVQKTKDTFTVAELMSGTGSYAFDWTLTALRKEEPQLRSGKTYGTADAAPQKIAEAPAQMPLPTTITNK